MVNWRLISSLWSSSQLLVFSPRQSGTRYKICWRFPSTMLCSSLPNDDVNSNSKPVGMVNSKTKAGRISKSWSLFELPSILESVPLSISSTMNIGETSSTTGSGGNVTTPSDSFAFLISNTSNIPFINDGIAPCAEAVLMVIAPSRYFALIMVLSNCSVNLSGLSSLMIPLYGLSILSTEAEKRRLERSTVNRSSDCCIVDNSSFIILASESANACKPSFESSSWCISFPRGTSIVLPTNPLRPPSCSSPYATMWRIKSEGIVLISTPVSSIKTCGTSILYNSIDIWPSTASSIS